ncbi:MAG: choice-of-anchor D domain-containing protein [Myxococcaceae bacterium]|nr:choice-of-anchor D domain-containing protein [Myxococcaceae bacterium]
MRSCFWVVALAAVLAVAGCRCDRGTNLSGRFAELVVVTVNGSVEQLSREAVVSVAAAPMGESSAGSVLVRNIGDATLTLESVKLVDGSTAFSITLPERTVLEPQEETTLTVTFSPEQVNDATLATVEHRATFELASLGGRPAETKASIELVAIAEARDCYVPALLDFGEAPIGQAVQIPLSLSNVTSAPAQATLGTIAGANPGFFSLDPPGPTIDVEAGVMRDVLVRFAPQTEDAVEAQVTVRRRASCPEATVRLIGRGSMQSLSWLPAEVNFGRVPLRESATRAVTFSNRSGAALALAVSTDGADFSTPRPMAVLPARGTLSIEVSCSPTSLNALMGTLRVDVGTSPVLPVRVPMRCSGGGPRLRPSPSPLAFGQVPVLLDQPGGRPLPLARQTLITRRLRLENVGTPPPAPNDTTFNLVLGRDGQPPLMSLSPLGTTQPGEFDVALGRYDAAAGVPAVASRNGVDVEVMLRPAAIGLREAMLTVYSNDAVQPVQQIRLTANGAVAQPCSIAVAPGSVLFGDVPPESNESQTLTLTNQASTGCLVSGLEIASSSHPGFSLAPQVMPSLTLGPGQSMPIPVRFNSGGLATGTVATGFLRFSTPGSTAPRVVPLSARVAQCLVVVPDEVEFGNIKLGCRSAARPVQIFNTCGTPIRLTGLSVTGQPFGISAQPNLQGGFPLAPSTGLAAVSLVFTPPALGTHAGVLSIQSVEGSSTRTVQVALRGQGDTTGTTTETYQQPAQPMTDILFTIDNSCSMGDEQAALAANFGSFISYANMANVDYRIAVTTTDDFAASGQGQFTTQGGGPAVLSRSMPNINMLFASRVNVGIFGSGYERPLSTTLKALTAPLTDTTNANFLRDDANLAIIIVTDAPDQSPEPIDYYLSRMPLVKGPRRIHQVSVSVIGPFTPASATCQIEGLDMGRYDPLVRKTGGVSSTICTQNWATSLQALGQSALGPRSNFFVRNPPDTAQPVDVLVNGQPVSNAWTYDANANAIVFGTGQAPAAGTTLTITYQSQCL